MTTKEFKTLLTRMFIVKFDKTPIKIIKRKGENKFDVHVLNRELTAVIKALAYHVPEFDTICLYSAENKFGGRMRQGVMKVSELRELEKNQVTKENFAPELISLPEIIEGLNNGTIKIDAKGHNISYAKGNNDYFINEIKKYVEELLPQAIERSKPEFWLEKKDPTNKTEEEIASDLSTSNSLAEIYTKLQTRKFRPYERIGAMGSSREFYCHNCGDRHDLMIVNANTIALAPTYDQKQAGNLDAVCMFADGLKPKVVELDMPSGDIVFANYFMVEGQDRHEDTVYDPKEDKYDQYSVSDHRGRTNRMNKLAESGIGYGQMGNMSIGIYVNKQRNKIIIGDSYPEDEVGEINLDYRQAKKDGFIYCGSISLGVWAYYLVDRENMVKYNTAPVEGGWRKDIESKNLTKDNKDGYYDRIIANVQKGKWRLTHYYDVTPDPEDGRLFKYAELELIE